MLAKITELRLTKSCPKVPHHRGRISYVLNMYTFSCVGVLFVLILCLPRRFLLSYVFCVFPSSFECCISFLLFYPRSPERPQKSGEELAAWVSYHLNSYCQKYRNTVFLVNSILHTRHSWLNSEIDTYNQIMYLFAQSIPNLEFIDSHTAITRHGIARRIDFVLDRSDGRGTHLTLDAKRIVARELVKACQSHASKSQMMNIMYYRNT